MRKVSIFRFSMQRPSDVSQLDALVSEGKLSPEHIKAIVAKTEGNGSLTDYTPELAERAFREWLSSRLRVPQDEIDREVAFFIEGGTEGVLSPHGLVFTVSDVDSSSPAGARLAFGMAQGAPLDLKDIGGPGLAANVANATRDAMKTAGLASAETVKCALVMTPTLTLGEIQHLKERGQEPVASLPESLAAASRRVAALGVAMALQQVKPATSEHSSGIEGSEVASSRAVVVARPFIARPRVLVMGNSETWGGSLAAAHAMMSDALDAQAIRAALCELSFPGNRSLQRAESERVVACFVKTEADPTGRIRGRRHVMLEDGAIHHTRHIRMVVGGTVAAAIGHPQIFVSAGAEGQGPAGGGPVCIIAELDA